VKTACARPGIESALANENALSRATDEGTVVEPELSQPISKSAKKHVNMYKNLRISNIFCTFAAAKVKLIYIYVV
jgi:hypothetical protein